MFWMLGRSARGEDFVSEFESPEPTWKIFLKPQFARAMAHERRREVGRSGSAEYIRVESTRENSPLRLEHPIPAATVLDELEFSVWVRSNHEGLALDARVTLPEIIDPETNATMTLRIQGDKYQTANQWQCLKCRTSDRAINDQLRLLRARKQIPIDPKSMYVERIALVGLLGPGETEVFIDDLTVQPMVQFDVGDVDHTEDDASPAHPSAVDSEAADGRSAVPVQFRLHRLRVEGQPFFPRMISYHHESPEGLAQAGINVAWVDDYENSGLTAPLRRQGLWITAAPPYAPGIDGEPLDSDDASLLPFQSSSAPVLFWMLGARLTPDMRPRLTSWTNQIRNADRKFNKRPIAADVSENERLCSRHVDLLGMSRHILNSSIAMCDYRDWLIQRRDLALPDTFCWTWIQTEPAPSLMSLARRVDSPPMLEPEQIRLQVYAALAAGCRGIGYWTSTRLDDDSPAARERLLAITQLNLELDLFESWITGGGTPQLVPFKLDSGRKNAPSGGSSQLDLRSGPKSPLGTTTAVKPPDRQHFAALIRSDRGILLLPMWLENNSQFVPGNLTARNVTIVVPGGGETAAAWEITTSGQLRYLDRELVAGGVQVKLPKLDQTAAVLITTTYLTVQELNQKIQAIQEPSARVSVELARLKLERILQVDKQLQTLNVHLPNGSQWLGNAKLNLDKAESALRAQQYSDARQFADQALQHGRHFQRNHWEYATRKMSSPTTSPWTGSFQSLPEHYRLLQQLEIHGSDTSDNLLPSGEFEDRNTLVAERWGNEQSLEDVIDSSAELFASPKQGNFCLKLSARPVDPTVEIPQIPKPPVTIVSPGVPVQTGQIVKMTGWVKVPAPLAGSFQPANPQVNFAWENSTATSTLDGALIYDSLLGKPGAVRFKAAQDWQRFEIIRPVPESQELTVTIALHGLGELLVDDLRITAIDPDAAIAAPNSPPATVQPSRFSPLDLRRLNPLPKRR